MPVCARLQLSDNEKGSKSEGGGEEESQGRVGGRAAPVLLPDQSGAFSQRTHIPQLSGKPATALGISAYHSIVGIQSSAVKALYPLWVTPLPGIELLESRVWICLIVPTCAWHLPRHWSLMNSTEQQKAYSLLYLHSQRPFYCA